MTDEAVNQRRKKFRVTASVYGRLTKTVRAVSEDDAMDKLEDMFGDGRIDLDEIDHLELTNHEVTEVDGG